jgi:hypothetical protein
MYTCPKCNGEKVFTMFAHVNHGICFQCDGTGKVDTLPTDTIDPEEVAVITTIFKDNDDGTRNICQFYSWDEALPSEWAGTGHWYECVVDTNALSDFKEQYGLMLFSDCYKRTELRDSDLHMPLDQVRSIYAAYIRAGFSLETGDINYLYGPKPCDSK